MLFFYTQGKYALCETLTFSSGAHHFILCGTSTHMDSLRCCCSVAWLGLTLCDPMDWSVPAFLVLHYLPVCSNSCPLNQWCHPTISSSDSPLLLLPSIFPSIRVFSKELALHLRWPKYWSFSIDPFNEYSGLISRTPLLLYLLMLEKYAATGQWVHESGSHGLLCCCYSLKVVFIQKWWVKLFNE